MRLIVAFLLTSLTTACVPRSFVDKAEKDSYAQGYSDAKDKCNQSQKDLSDKVTKLTQDLKESNEDIKRLTQRSKRTQRKAQRNKRNLEEMARQVEENLKARFGETVTGTEKWQK